MTATRVNLFIYTNHDSWFSKTGMVHARTIGTATYMHVDIMATFKDITHWPSHFHLSLYFDSHSIYVLCAMFT